MHKPIPARIGMVSFINTAPLYDVWKRTVRMPEWRIIEAPPTTLNRMLYRDELDLALISSHEYAVNPFHYRILDGLSINATGPVGSVFLFSLLNPQDLSDKTVLLSSKSQTSAALAKIILEEFFHVKPRYLSGEAVRDSGRLLNGGEPVSAVLAIGDDAIRLTYENRYPFKLDLGDVWYQHTGLSFVFAIWAVREEFFQEAPACVKEIHQELLRCVSKGREELYEISRRVAPEIPMPVDDCFAYLSGMGYGFEPDKQQALTVFYNYVIKRGEGAAEALPLRMC